MPGKNFLDILLAEHTDLRDHLLDWETALGQLDGSGYEQCQRAVHVLREMCTFFEHATLHHLREEEAVLYPVVAHKLPRLRGLILEFHREHDVFRQRFEEFRRELTRFNTTGELLALPRLGGELVALLRAHMEREERELLPLVLTEFRDEDWRALRRLFVESEVA